MLSNTLRKVLVVLKVPTYNALSLESQWGKKKQIDDILTGYKASKDFHELNCSKIIESMTKNGFDFDIKLYNEIDSKIENYDLVITLGGDGTFLRAATYIHDDTPIIGMNTDPARSFCNFASYNPKVHPINLNVIWEKLRSGQYGIQKRTRIEVNFNEGSNENIKSDRIFALNEVLFADSSIARASNFRMTIDDKANIPYRSSGIIVSTGSGSTGMMKSAMTIDPEVIKEIVYEREKKILDQMDAIEFSKTLMTKHMIPGSSRELFYFVREPLIQKQEDRTKKYRGNAKKIVIQSVMDQATIAMDGHELRKVQFGETFTLTPSEHDLKCITLSF